MKKIVMTMLLLAVVAITPVFASGHVTLQGNIPFDFVVAGKTLPAGEYEVADTYSDISLHIRSVDGENSAFALTNKGYAGPNAEPTFIFANVGGKYYLTGVTRSGVARELSRKPQGGTGVLAYVKAVLR